MGNLSILTLDQKTILSEVQKNSLLKEQFYLTGGTALSAFYLSHRHSDDLDFFSEQQFDNQVIFTLIEMWSKKHNFTFQSNFMEVTYIFNLAFSKERNLKIDFSYYPYKRVENGQTFDGIQIDSIFDIAINKLLVVTQRSDVKDFVDLYFLLERFSVWDLIEGVKVKFRTEIDPFILAADFLKIEDFDYLPRMIKPITLGTLKIFYRNRSKELGKRGTK